MSRIKDLNELWDNRHIGDEVEFFLKQIISGCINDINALNNRLLKLQELVSSVPKFDSKIVDELPPVEEASRTIIYLLPNENYYDEYMVADSDGSLIWKKIASSKPVGGIPLSDLSSEVQDVVDNAAYIYNDDEDEDLVDFIPQNSGGASVLGNVNVLNRAINNSHISPGVNSNPVGGKNGSSEFAAAVQDAATDFSYQEQNEDVPSTDLASSAQENFESAAVSIPRSITYSSLAHLDNTSQKKPCICFQMDWGQYSAQSCQAYAEKLGQYGIDKSTYSISLSRMEVENDLSQVVVLYEGENEIALHTDSSHASINSKSTLTVSQFNELMNTYRNEMYELGFADCAGCVVFRAALKDEFFDEIKNHFDWIVAGPSNYNGDVDDDSYLSAIMTTSTNYQFVKRLSVELTPERVADKNFDYEQRIVDNVKNAIDQTIANNGFLIIYCHSYAVSNATYTLTDNVLTGILEYLQPLLESGACFTGNTNELVEYYFAEHTEER